MKRRQYSPSAGREGFTLTEVLIAFAVLAMILTGFYTGYIAAMRTQLMASDLYKANSIARNRIQRARAMEFAGLAMLAETNSVIDEYGNLEVGAPFLRTTTITSLGAECQEVTVQVYYPVKTSGLSPEPVELKTQITSHM